MSNILIQSFTPNTTVPGLPPVLQPRSRNIITANPYNNPKEKPDELGQMLEVQWKGVSFPTVMFEEKNSMSLVKHLYPNQDNARVENTGFNPREWTLIAHLTNHIFPGPNETWVPGTLFPDVFNALTAKLQDKTSGLLQHPIKGNVICKVVSWDWRLTGDGPRDGVIITANFLECLDDNIKFISNKAAISSMAASARALDNLVPSIPSNFHPPGLNLAGIFGQVAAYVQALSAFPSQVAQSLNSRLLATVSNFSQILAGFITAPAQAYNAAIGIWNLNRQTLFGAANFFQAINFTSSTILNGSNFGPIAAPTFVTGGQIANTSTVANNNINNTVNYDLQSLANVHTAYQALCTTSNVTPTQLETKVENFLVALYNYYKAIKDNQTAPMQQQLLQMLFAIQQLQLVSANKNNNYITLSFVNQMDMTFIDVANYTNNSIDDIMTLNVDLSNGLFIIPRGTTIQYNSATGA